jgi:hypothetical protein
MTSNGSESLNSLFRVERILPVAVIMEGIWYKCAKWFDKREIKVLNLHRAYKPLKKLMTSYQKVMTKQIHLDIFSIFY